MFESVNTPEVARLALVIGAFVGLNYRMRHGVIPGGVIVPGFAVILFLISPIWCLTIFALSFPLYWFYIWLLKKPDYKTRTPMYILAVISLTISYLIASIYIQKGWLNSSFDSLSGGLIPAIIAFTWTKQKMKLVVQGLSITILQTSLILTVVYLVGFYVFNLDFNYIRPYYIGKAKLEFEYTLMQFILLLIVGYWLYRYHNIRPGGYLIAPAAANLLTSPLSAILVIFGFILTYYLTTYICQYSLTVGLNRYGLALFISTIYVWGIELLFLRLDSTLVPFLGSNIFIIIVIMSYVNDTILYKDNNVIKYILFMLFFAVIIKIITNTLSILIV